MLMDLLRDFSIKAAVNLPHQLEKNSKKPPTPKKSYENIINI